MKAEHDAYMKTAHLPSVENLLARCTLLADVLVVACQGIAEAPHSDMAEEGARAARELAEELGDRLSAIGEALDAKAMNARINLRTYPARKGA